MADEPTVDNDTTSAETGDTPAKKTAARKTAAKRTTAKKTTAKKATTKKTAAKSTAKRTTKKAAAAEETQPESQPETPGDVTAEASAQPTTEPTTEPASGPVTEDAAESTAETPAKTTTTRKTAARKTTAKKTTAKKAAAKKTTAKRTTKKPAESAAEAAGESAAETPVETPATSETPTAPEQQADQGSEQSDAAPAVLFQAPDAAKAAPRKRTSRRKAPVEPAVEPTEEPTVAGGADERATTQQSPETTEAPAAQPAPAAEAEGETQGEDESKDRTGDETGDEAQESGAGRRRRRRGGRRRRKSSGDAEAGDTADTGTPDESGANGESEAEGQAESGDGEEQAEGGGSSRRRRRRRRSGDSGADNADDPEQTVTKVRQGRPAEDQITALSGSTRLEAKKQRRREGREAGRRRAPIVSEAEFLARRESVDRVMVIRQRDDLTQIAVLEDKVLVEHYVARESQTSLIGNVYLGRVQNVLPSMEAAFIDIGKGRNAVLYAGEVNWSALGWKEGQPRKIESVLTSGQKVLVQVTKDPIGHKGSRLTSQISLAGRFLVYVPDGTTSGISRKLPDTERNRLKTLLKEIVPDSAGVIVRTAAEGASEDELTADVERLKARWEEIEKKAGGNAPQLLYGEPDLTLKVVRDLFTEDFSKLIIQGDDAWDTVQGYVSYVAPDLEERLEKYDASDGRDAFAAYRIDEQIAKGLDRKVWLPSGGSLIIDRTEAMTVVDVNTGKFTGSGGNLEETVTKNNLEAAEEIVRQLRLRDIGGIIVVDFIDMVLESNRDLVLRRLVECLGRDRTRHQVAEVTSLGLVQMTRKRIGTGLLEAFSETCEHCGGRGLIIHDHPVEAGRSSGVAADEPRGRRRRGRGKGGNDDARQESTPSAEAARTPTPAEFAAMAAKAERSEGGDRPESADQPAQSSEPTGSEQQAPTGQAQQSGTEAQGASTPEPDEQPAKPARARSTRGRSARSGKTTVEAPVAAESAVTPLEPVAMEETSVDPGSVVPSPSSDGASSDGASTAAEPERPKVVTRTRRRAASRPAGSPAQASEVQPMVVEAPVVVPAAEPVVAPEPPKVITRTRRGASRPAGATAAEPAGEVLVEGTDADESHDESPIEHVPVKKRGSKKR